VKPEGDDVKEFFPEVLYAVDLRDNICGHPGFVHGGLIATLLDESMGIASHVSAGPGHFTANLNIDYQRPLKVNQWALIRVQVTFYSSLKCILPPPLIICLGTNRLPRMKVGNYLSVLVLKQVMAVKYVPRLPHYLLNHVKHL
jgi:hypothetical protein